MKNAKAILAILVAIFAVLFFVGAFIESALACAICEFAAVLFAAAAAIVFTVSPDLG